MARPKPNSGVLTSAIAALLGAVARTASAEPVGAPVTSDLNGDGRPERFALTDWGDGTMDLSIRATGGADIRAMDIAWIGGIGQQPALSLAPFGSVRLTSMNEAIGRDWWHLTLTIAFRREIYTVASSAARPVRTDLAA